jgi:hypothetical protein
VGRIPPGFKPSDTSHNIFGGLLDTIEDDWIEAIEKLEEMMDKYMHLREQARDVFEMQYQTTIDPGQDRWELCSRQRRPVTDEQFQIAKVVDEGFATQDPAMLSELSLRIDLPLPACAMKAPNSRNSRMAFSLCSMVCLSLLVLLLYSRVS